MRIAPIAHLRPSRSNLASNGGRRSCGEFDVLAKVCCSVCHAVVVNLVALTHGLLLRTSGLRDAPGIRGRMWRMGWRWAERRWGSRLVGILLHGRHAKINFANPYPLYARQFPNYNGPQVEAVLLSAELTGGSVDVVDVGAAVGDTALLLFATCKDTIQVLHCVEGEPDFYRLLERNLRGTRAIPHLAMLADAARDVPSLIRAQHQGTASAQGRAGVRATSLDSLIGSADVIKVDTDGYDGLILAGASRLLLRSPVVLFEWHPLACRRVGTEERQAFEVLDSHGYDRFVFFSKFGEFSHYMFCLDHEALDAYADICLASATLQDWHYDVLALPPSAQCAALTSIAGLERWAGARRQALA